jgi:hypothetical protein
VFSNFYSSPGWRSWSDSPALFLRRRPLTILGRPPPTAVVDSQWGEPRSEAFGTHARVAGSSVNVVGPAAPCGQPLVLAILETVNPNLSCRGGRTWGRARVQATATCGSNAMSGHSVAGKCCFTDPSSHHASEGNEIVQGSTALRCASYHRVSSIALDSHHDCLEVCFRYLKSRCSNDS